MTDMQERSFDDSGFLRKLKRVAQAAGFELVEKSLWLYYAARADETPAWAKSVIYGALAYFVLPFDAIPDMIPITGFTDDLGALSAAVVTVAMFIDDDIRQRTRDRMRRWFGEPRGTSPTET